MCVTLLVLEHGRVEMVIRGIDYCRSWIDVGSLRLLIREKPVLAFMIEWRAYSTPDCMLWPLSSKIMSMLKR